MTNDSKNQETEGNNATQVATGRWRSDIFGHETGDQIRIGLEKIIADLPEPTVMTEWMLQGDRDDLPPGVDLGDKLRGRVEKMETCGNDGMTKEVRHTACGRPNSWLPVQVFYCHQPGCPRCWLNRVGHDLGVHSKRLAAAFDGGYRMLRLDAPPGWGPDRTRTVLAGLLRRRTIKPHLKPYVGTWLPVVIEGAVRYSITLIVHDDFPTDMIAEVWSDITDGQAATLEQPIHEADADTMDTHRRIGDFDDLASEGEWDPHPVEASTTLHELKVAADQAIPLLVASGHLDPATAATWMIEDANRPKLKYGGGFQEIAPAVKRDSINGDQDATDAPADSPRQTSYHDEEFDDEQSDDEACLASPRETTPELGEAGHAADDDDAEYPPIQCPYDPRCALTFTGRATDTETLTHMGYEMNEFPGNLTLWERKERLRPASD